MGEPPFCTRWRPGLTPRGLEVRGSGDPAGDRAWPPPPPPHPRPLTRSHAPWHGKAGGKQPAQASLRPSWVFSFYGQPAGLWLPQPETKSWCWDQAEIAGLWGAGRLLGVSGLMRGRRRGALSLLGELPGTPAHPRPDPEAQGTEGTPGCPQRGCETRWSPSSGRGAGPNPRAGCWDTGPPAVSPLRCPFPAVRCRGPGPPDGTLRLLGGFSPGDSSTSFSRPLSGHHSCWISCLSEYVKTAILGRPRWSSG